MSWHPRYNRFSNRRAGANPNAKEARGKHTHASRYKPGANWVECQRCGHDLYCEDAREDGYTKGLIVCPKCYDNPHPQDYVRAYTDKISPSCFVTGATTDNDPTDFRDGSTNFPCAQANMCTITGDLGTLPARTDAESDVISITAATVTAQFPTALYDPLLAAAQTATYTAEHLPDGLSINASTGAISGTISTDANALSPHTTTVIQTWTDCVAYKISFTWTVTDSAGPASVTGLCLWWDFSDTTTMWQDTGKTTPATSTGHSIKTIDDKSGNGNDGVEATSTREPLVKENGNGTKTVGDFAFLTNSRHLETLSMDAISDGYTVFIVYKVPSSVGALRTAFGATNANGNFHGFDTDNTIYTESNRTSPSYNDLTNGTDESGTFATKWKAAMVQWNGASTLVEWNNANLPGGAWSGHDVNGITSSGFKAGATFNNSGSWDSEIAEVLVYKAVVDATDQATLQTYFAARWTLDS